MKGRHQDKAEYHYTATEAASLLAGQKPFIPNKFIRPDNAGEAMAENHCLIKPSELAEHKRQRFLATIEELAKGGLALIETKNRDYTGLSPDPFFNFSDEEMDLFFQEKGIQLSSVENGLLKRISEKRKRLYKLILFGPPKVLTDTLEDTLIDLSNYSLILLAYYKIHGRLDIKVNFEKAYEESVGDTNYLRSIIEDQNRRIKELLEFQTRHQQKELDRQQTAIDNFNKSIEKDAKKTKPGRIKDAGKRRS